MNALPAYEQIGSFYLGKKYDQEGRRLLDEKVLYDARDLTTHALCVGMTGSGKTGLCLSLIEEAAIDGLPIICIDPKGDLGNLLLTFPDFQASDYAPWVEPAEAACQGVTADELARQTAERWKQGLADWEQDGDRVRRFREAVDCAIYTPGSSAGIPMTVLKNFEAPPAAVLANDELMRERVAGTTSGLLTLLEVDADPLSSREHILLANIFDTLWRQGHSLHLPSLIRAIQTPPFEKVGVVDLESFYPSAERVKLSMRLNNLLASPSFSAWLDGQPLDVKRLLHTTHGKPRLSIISIAHLSDSERMFFVTLLLNELIVWMRSQPGTSSLRAIFYMDEIFGYFPPTAMPPSKTPMLLLLKQARAYGLGLVLATQNPVDLDYKGLSNIGTWFLGRLQTERDKQRVIELLNVKQFKAWEKELRNHLYRNLPLRLFRCAELKATSRPGQDERDARAAWAQMVREQRDAEKVTLLAKFSAKQKTLEAKMLAAERRLEKETAQYNKEKSGTLLNFGQTLLGALMGNKVTARTATTGRSLGRAAQQRTDVQQANEVLEQLAQEKQSLEEECQREIRDLGEKYRVEALTLTPLDFACRKGDIQVKSLTIDWIPWQLDAAGMATPLVELPEPQ